MTDIKINKQHKEDLIFFSVAKYTLFMAQRDRGGYDALLLYAHLLFTGQLQESTTVRATNSYIKKGLCWGDGRLSKAKKLLIDLELIEPVIRRDKNTGTIEGHYIKVINISPKTALKQLQIMSENRERKINVQN